MQYEQICSIIKEYAIDSERVKDLDIETILQYGARIMIILLINPLHEFAHAWSAHKLGDDTAKQAGRLTISPLAHLDPAGSLLLLLFGFGWAKPVPVNPRNFKNPSQGMMLTAIAGPLSNLAAALVGMIGFQMISGVTQGSSLYYLAILLYFFIVININLFVFNMIPVPPLDGSRVLTYFLPAQAQIWFMKNQQYFYIVVMLLMITGLLSTPISFIGNLIYRMLAFLTSWIPPVL